MKHLKAHQRYSAAHCIFNSLFSVSSGDETLHLMLDILLKSAPLHPATVHPLFHEESWQDCLHLSPICKGHEFEMILVKQSTTVDQLFLRLRSSQRGDLQCRYFKGKSAIIWGTVSRAGTPPFMAELTCFYGISSGKLYSFVNLHLLQLLKKVNESPDPHICNMPPNILLEWLRATSI